MKRFLILSCAAMVALSAVSCNKKPIDETDYDIPVPVKKGGSEWVYIGSNGKLGYGTTAKGDRIMDFSHAGYKGGGVPLPVAEVKETVAPVADGGDCTAAIQAAIDKVSKLPMGKDGLRGAVLLKPGTFPCSKSIKITEDGVVLRGSGVGTSIIYMTGKELYTAVVLNREGARMGGNRNGSITTGGGVSVKVTDRYVHAGSKSVHVENAAGINPGDLVEISKPVTEKWLHFMEMDDLVRDGAPQTWIKVGTRMIVERTVSAVQGNEVAFTVPLVDSYDAQYTDDNTLVTVIPVPDRVRNSGMENFTIQCPVQAVSHTEALYYAVSLYGEDCWMKDVTALETMESIRMQGCRLTLRNVNVLQSAANVGSSKPAEFAPNAGQVLCDHCSVKGDNIWYVGVGSGQTGPIVFLNCTFTGNGHSEGHQRWSTGFLFDNCKSPGGGFDFRNRGNSGSGHGWGTAWAVAWNCEAKSYINQLPPGTCNWVIGCKGEKATQRRPGTSSGPTLPEGIYDHHGTPVEPKSLYLSQLEERLGKAAVMAIGY